MKTDEELIEEARLDFKNLIRSNDLDVGRDVQRVYAETGELMGAWVTAYLWIDDSEEEGDA